VPGQILVAPPDHHLVIDDGHVRLTGGPRENNHRPAVDALFRSAAVERGDGVIGVVLSGTRDDGTAGLAVIKAHGGMAIVQDPEDALYPGMPASAIANVAVDAVVPSARVAEAIVALVAGDRTPDPPLSDLPRTDSKDVNPAVTICPECGGVLTEYSEAGAAQWQCRVGHRYSPESLVEAQSADVEAALWSAVRALEDRALLLRRLAGHFRTRGRQASADRFGRRAKDAEAQASLVHRALVQAALTSLRDSTGEGHDGWPAQEGVG
jgi:two-component system chemotaxis response regulator CheB